MKLIFCILALISAIFCLQKEQEYISPCPDVLDFEDNESKTDDTWYGHVNLTTEDDLQGVYAHVVLDRPAIKLEVSMTARKNKFALRCLTLFSRINVLSIISAVFSSSPLLATYPHQTM